MKRTFLPKRNWFSGSGSISLDALALVVVMVLLFVRLAAPNLFWYVFVPLFHSGDTLSAGTHSFLKSFSDAAALATKNEQLASENAALASENQALGQKDAALAGLDSSAKASSILAGVIARPPESPYDTLLVAAGSEQGVVLDMEAFGPGNVPIGVVSSVFGNLSRVTLFSSPGMTTSGWVGRSHAPVSIVGAGAGALHASVARSAGIGVGDVVSAPGPGALPLGSVVRIDSDASSPAVTLQIRGASNLFSTTWIALRDVGATLRTTFSSATSTLP